MDPEPALSDVLWIHTTEIYKKVCMRPYTKDKKQQLKKKGSKCPSPMSSVGVK